MKSGQISRMLMTLGVVLFTSSAHAATTDWLTERQLWSFIKTKMGSGEAAKYCATAIECGEKSGKTYFRMTYQELNGVKPFHKWQWVHGEASKLTQLAAKIPLKSRPELKYRIVHKNTFKAQNGTQMGCAIVYR